MPFGTVWQLNLNVGGGGGGGSSGGGVTLGGIPGTPAPTPQRFSVQYVVGQGFFTPQMPTVSPSPLIGPTGEVPVHPYLFGVDFDEDGTVTVPAMAAGASMTITQAVSLPDVPQIQLSPTDQGSVQINPQVYQNPIVPGLIIASVQCQPQALEASTKTWVPASDLTAGQTYTAVRAYFTISLYAAVATTTTQLVLGAASQVIIFSS